MLGQKGPQRGRAQASQGKNACTHYYETVDGEPVEGHYLTDTRSFCRQFALLLERLECAPATWGDADIEITTVFYEAVRTRFPPLQLCAGDWKAQKLMTDTYNAWNRYRGDDANAKALVTDVSLADAPYKLEEDPAVPPPQVPAKRLCDDDDKPGSVKRGRPTNPVRPVAPALALGDPPVAIVSVSAPAIASDSDASATKSDAKGVSGVVPAAKGKQRAPAPYVQFVSRPSVSHRTRPGAYFCGTCAFRSLMICE